MSLARFASSEAKSVPGTPRSNAARNISFSPRIQFHDTYASDFYDRRGEIATCNRLTPMLAQQIKEELNSFKMVGLMLFMAVESVADALCRRWRSTRHPRSLRTSSEHGAAALERTVRFAPLLRRSRSPSNAQLLPHRHITGHEHYDFYTAASPHPLISYPTSPVVGTDGSTLSSPSYSPVRTLSLSPSQNIAFCFFHGQLISIKYRVPSLTRQKRENFEEGSEQALGVYGENRQEGTYHSMDSGIIFSSPPSFIFPHNFPTTYDGECTECLCVRVAVCLSDRLIVCLSFIFFLFFLSLFIFHISPSTC